MRTVYVDTCVLMLAFKAAEDSVSLRALQELDREDVQYLYSPIVQLECIPLPTKNRQAEEVQFYSEFFAAAARIPCDEDAQQRAMELGCLHGLSAPDALHTGCAVIAKADEFVTAEGLTKGLGSLHDSVIGPTTFRTIRVSD